MTTYFINRYSGVVHRHRRCGYLARSDLDNTARWTVTETAPPGCEHLYDASGDEPDERCEQCYSPTFRPPT